MNYTTIIFILEIGLLCKVQLYWEVREEGEMILMHIDFNSSLVLSQRIYTLKRLKFIQRNVGNESKWRWSV